MFHCLILQQANSYGYLAKEPVFFSVFFEIALKLNDLFPPQCLSSCSLQFLKDAGGDSFSETKQPQLVTSGTIDHQVNTEGFLGH